MRGYSIEKMAMLHTEMEHMFVESNDITSRDAYNGSAVGCIISGSCRLKQDGALRVIPERMLYVIDNRTESVENVTNSVSHRPTPHRRASESVSASIMPLCRA